MNLLRVALLLLASTWALPVLAECDCIWGGPFSRVQAGTDLVVSATVTTMQGNSIDLDIQQVLRGEIYSEQLRLWLDTDELCRAEVGTFPLNSQWVMALDRIDELAPGGFNPSHGTYELIGPKVQGNPEGQARHRLVSHRDPLLILNGPAGRTFDELELWLTGKDLEGIVWHHEDDRMAKIKLSDFGLKRPS